MQTSQSVVSAVTKSFLGAFSFFAVDSIEAQKPRDSTALPAVVIKAEKKWEIDRIRCILCGYCVDVCPKKCLTADNFYASPSGARADFHYEITQPEKPAPAAKPVETQA